MFVQFGVFFLIILIVFQIFLAVSAYVFDLIFFKCMGVICKLKCLGEKL